MESPSVQGNDRVPHNTSIFFCIKSSAHKQKMKTIKNHPAVDHWCNLKAFLLNHPKLLTHFSSPFRYSIYPKKNTHQLPRTSIFGPKYRQKHGLIGSHLLEGETEVFSIPIVAHSCDDEGGFWGLVLAVQIFNLFGVKGSTS